jgi:hypothetical protein
MFPVELHGMKKNIILEIIKGNPNSAINDNGDLKPLPDSSHC